MSYEAKMLPATLALLLICALAGCSGQSGEIPGSDIMIDPDRILVSPSGNYEAKAEEFMDNGVKSYRLHIIDFTGQEDTKHTLDIVFRARDANFVLWADEEDVLLAYNGDIGTFCYVNKNGTWVKEAYDDNKNMIVPQVLKDARPSLFMQ